MADVSTLKKRAEKAQALYTDFTKDVSKTAAAYRVALTALFQVDQAAAIKLAQHTLHIVPSGDGEPYEQETLRFILATFDTLDITKPDIAIVLAAAGKSIAIKNLPDELRQELGAFILGLSEKLNTVKDLSADVRKAVVQANFEVVDYFNDIQARTRAVKIARGQLSFFLGDPDYYEETYVQLRDTQGVLDFGQKWNRVFGQNQLSALQEAAKDVIPPPGECHSPLQSLLWQEASRFLAGIGDKLDMTNPQILTEVFGLAHGVVREVHSTPCLRNCASFISGVSDALAKTRSEAVPREIIHNNGWRYGLDEATRMSVEENIQALRRKVIDRARSCGVIVTGLSSEGAPAQFSGARAEVASGRWQRWVVAPIQAVRQRFGGLFKLDVKKLG